MKKYTVKWTRHLIKLQNKMEKLGVTKVVLYPDGSADWSTNEQDFKE